MLQTKDRAELATVIFDFTALAAIFGLTGVLVGQDYAAATDYFAEDYVEGSVVSVSDPVIQVARDYGDDQLVVSGAVHLDGLKVTQIFSGGTRGKIYDVAALVTFANGDRRRLAHSIRVT